MSITDELRKWAGGSTISSWTAEPLTAIADRIDAKHEKACAEAYGNGVESVALPDLTAYVKLPLDADGVPIHIGDEMALQHEVKEKPYVVQSLTWDGEDWYFTSDEGFFNACGWEHYHESTVEDVLCELLNEYREGGCTLEETLLSDFAAKLRLADDEKER